MDCNAAQVIGAHGGHVAALAARLIPRSLPEVYHRVLRLTHLASIDTHEDVRCVCVEGLGWDVPAGETKKISKYKAKKGCKIWFCVVEVLEQQK